MSQDGSSRLSQDAAETTEETSMSTTEGARELARARQAFLEDGVRPGAFLAPHIRRSWERCQPTLSQALLPIEPLPRDRLGECRDASEWLLRCAQPELDALAEHVVGNGCVVILSDASGLILEEVGSPEFLPKARRVALQPGVVWSELQRGTNAIGTALVERQPVMVLGAEHLLSENSGIGCSAAPIATERGELAGVLDISGESVRMDVHSLGLVRMAAAQVEHRMMTHPQRSGRAEELVHFHVRPGLLGTPREGLLSVVDGRIVGLNRAAAELLPGGWAQWLDVPVETLFGERWRALRRAPGLYALRGGRSWAVAVDTLHAHRPYPAPSIASAARDDSLEAQLERARRLLDADLAVLITGETGVGKDVFARRLHAASKRAGKPMVAVNCAAIPETLIEAELFGYEDGAFTGARRGGSPGRLREASGGVLFLDEIGDMPLALQPRLLRVLEERRVRPLGSTRDVAVDFALVCASHRDLAALVREGRFREDLMYRLRGYEIRLPPLRERADRRELILTLFRELGGDARGIALSEAALDVLDHHPWPGNVRQLVALLRGVLALAEPGDLVLAEDLPLAAAGPASAATRPVPPPALPNGVAREPAPLADMTAQAIEQALQRSGGNIAAAARALGVHRSTLYRQKTRRA